MSSSSLTNGNDGYHSLSSNGVVIGSGEPVLQQQQPTYINPNTSYDHPQQNHLSSKIQSYDSTPFLPPASSSSSINSSSTPNLLACLSSNARALPPASELLSLPTRAKGVNEEGNRQFGPNGSVGIPSGQQGLPSISSFGQKPPTPSMQQAIPSPCIPPPPSPYLLPPSNYQYQCMTEPGTPAMGFINPNGIGEQHQQQAVYGIPAHSPSFASSMHGSNPGSIMSAPPESPASASANQSGIQFSPSIKNTYNVRMASSTPDYSLEINHSNNFYPVDGSHSNDGYSMPNMNSRSTPVQQLYMATTSNAQPCNQQQNLGANPANRAYKSPNYQSRGAARGSTKNTMTSILPILPLRTGDDGPTVKEHLQQQQAAQRQKMQQEILSKRLRDDDIKETKRVPDQSLTNSSSSTSSLAMKPNATFLHPSPRSLLMDQFPQEVLSPPKPPKSSARRQVSRTNSGNGTSQPSSNKSRSYVSRVSRLASTIASVASGQSTGSSFAQSGTRILSPHKFQSSGPGSPVPIGTPPKGVKRSLQAPQRPALKGPRLEEDLQGPPSQCRISVQNPPNAIDCDFPPTETTIHVVQQPRYQDGRFASNSQRSGTYEGNSNPNIFRAEEGRSVNAVISVQQHPSVAHIQQQRGVTGYLETRPANYRVVESGQKGQKRPGDPSPELVHHVIVQSSNPGPSFQPNQSSNVDNNYNGGLSQQLLSSSMRGAPPGCGLLNSTIPPSQPLVPNARQNKTSMSRITPGVYAAPGGAVIFANNNPMVITNSNVCGNQRNDVQLAAVRQKDVEFRKYSIKLYHLQRTIKALVYKNGALSDELARLNQRIYTVTEERKMLAKRLQHHERNRIRRIQTQHRKAAAAARKAVLINQIPEADKTTARTNARRPAGLEAECAPMQPLSVNITEPDHNLFATMKSPSSIDSSNGTNYSPRISQSPRPAYSSANLLTTVATTSIINSHSQSSSIMSSANADDDLMAAGRSRSNSADLGQCNNHTNHSPSQRSDRRSSTSTQNSSFNSTATQNSQQRPTRQSIRQLQIQQEKMERQQQEAKQQQAVVSSLKTETVRKSSASPKVSSAGSVASDQKANSNTSVLDNHISPRSRASRAASKSLVDSSGNPIESNNVSTSSKRNMRSKDRSVDKTDVNDQSNDVYAIAKSVPRQNCHGDLFIQQQPHHNPAQLQPVSAHLRSAVPARRQARRNNGEV